MIRTIQQFYSLMTDTATVRRRAVGSILSDSNVNPGDTKALACALRSLEEIPHHDSRYELIDGRRPGGSEPIRLELDYELGELKKDIVFIEKGEQALFEHLASLHPGFAEQRSAALAFCRDLGFPLRCLISDRDGTVNNYCGRYLSSIQSIYNAVFLTRFAARVVRHALVLTSAPLSDGGLENLTVSPPGSFILAGSKGREYLDSGGRRGSLPIEEDKQRQLDRLNEQLSRLLREPSYQLHGLIGSGLQFKFGQTTVARQDIYGSIPAQQSEAFARAVSEIVRRVDPKERYFRIEDTGKDIEIILTVEGEAGLKDFDKGDGIRFLEETLDLGLDSGGNLVCGDTPSDVPMVEAAVARSGDTAALFVTRDPALQDSVRSICARTFFVSEPDILVGVLNQLGKESG